MGKRVRKEATQLPFLLNNGNGYIRFSMHQPLSLFFKFSVLGVLGNLLFKPHPLLSIPPSQSTLDQRILGDKYPGPRAHQPPIPATLLCHIVAEASLKRH